MGKYPSIVAPEVWDHEKCTQTVNQGGNPGDVRRCKHGLIMFCYQRGGVIRSSGYGPMYSFWQGLSPLFSPIRYRRAKRALEAV